MKIKEICEKTDLTERAIRLYIENGLVTPSINESYSGRRNIDFSEEDAERLRSISVLRKAGFSISQIKLMQQEPEKSKEVLQEFLEKTNERIETDSEIVACLTPLLSYESLNSEQISKSLENPVIEEKAIPAEDSEPSALQKLIRKLFFGMGVAGLIIAVLSIIPIVRVEIQYVKAYLYPYYSVNDLNYAVMIMALCGAILLPAGIILLNRKNSFRSRKKEKIKFLFSIILITLCAFCTYYTFGMAFLASMAHPEAYVVSHTTDTENYMGIDAVGAREVLPEFLPEELPDVEGIKYDYFYKEYGVWHEPPLTRIYVEIPLDEESFLKTVEHYKAFRPSDSVCEPYEETKGDWTIIYYREELEHPSTNYTPIFAFNEKTDTVRLMCRYGRETMKGVRGSTGDFEYKW